MLEDLRILYVEDRKHDNELFCEFLSPFVKTIRTAFDGEEGLEIYKDYRPDIVITDIQMPRMDGLEMSEKIKQIDPEQQIIIFSAFDFNNYFQRSIDIGVFGYILKPLNPHNLFDQLNKCAEVIDAKKENLLNKKKLEFNEKYLNSIFETSQDMIITTYGNKLDKANNAMFEFTGYSGIEEFKEDYDCICDLFVEKEGFLQKEINGKTWIEHIISTPESFHKAIIIKEGKSHTFGVKATKLEFDNHQRYLAFLTDITKLLEKEEYLKQKDELIMAQSRQASMGEMIGMIAHQWKQPLSVLSMIANNQIADIAFKEEISNKRIGNDSKDILRQVDYLSCTIDDFRNFLKPNKEKDTKPIKYIINKAMDIIGKILEKNGIEIITVYDNENLEITTYTKELIQVLINIINNSKDAAKENKIENAKIDINVRENSENSIIIEISDNAKGVNEDILEKIFDSYFTTKDEEKGTGIGLYMCKQIVNKHLKGSIEAENKNEGLSITLKLPLFLN